MKDDEIIAEAFRELEDILSSYPLGKLVSYKKDNRGTVNTSFIVEIQTNAASDRFFLRRYKAGIIEDELVFEHAIIDHLIANGFHLVAGVIKTRDGQSFVKRLSGEAPIFYALFEFLEGEDRYTWIDPACTLNEIRSAARVLAKFHQAVYGWTPPGKRLEPKIAAFLPLLSAQISACLQRPKQTGFDAYLLANEPRVQAHLGGTLRTLLDPVYADLPQLVIHSDFHPGNLKFQDEEVVGLFDFDWSKIDARCFDVALAIVYFFSSWKEANDGRLDLDGLRAFLQAYQHASLGGPGPGPLNHKELECLPAMICAGNLYVLNWAIQDYYHKEVDAQEYLRYLRHCVNLIRWFEDDLWRAQLEDVIASVESPSTLESSRK